MAQKNAPANSKLLTLTCKHIMNETVDVKTFIFDVPQNDNIHFINYNFCTIIHCRKTIQSK